jgi:hypothetical protein
MRMRRLAHSVRTRSYLGTSLQMNACTLHNLEILHNATDGRFEVRLRPCGAFETRPIM